jgi:hypothetical protein
MKTKFNSIFALIGAIVIIALSACEKDQPIPEPTQPYKGTVELRFVPTMNGEAFQQNVNFVGPNNFRMNIETLKFYLSDIQLINSSYTTMLSEIELVDLVQNDKTISFETDPGTYQQLKFFLGVKKALNGTDNPDFDEAQFPISHPLSIYNGMYWSWASGYIFSKIDGKIDTSQAQNQTPTFTWFYHSGLDTCYTEKNFNNLNIEVNAGKTTTIEIGIEVNDIFRQPNDTINMVDDNFTHTTDNIDLARKVAQNLAASMRKL